MKHLINRLFAGLLAGVIFFSSNLIPFASAYSGTSVGTSVSQISTEGAMPPDKTDVVLPTQAKQGNLFNFILDPNSLIRQTNAAAYGGVDVGPGNLYFYNRDEDGELIGLSRDSDPFVVINKTTYPLSLELKVTVDKGSNQFDFAKTIDFKNAEGNKITDRAIYLALVNGRRQAPVQTVTPKNGTATHTAHLKGWIEKADAYEIAVNARTQQYEYVLKDDYDDDEDFPSTSFYMTGAINSADWSDFRKFEFNVRWDVTTEKGPESNPIPDEDTDPSVLVLNPAVVIDDEALLSFDYGWGEKEMARITQMLYTNASGREVKVEAVKAADAVGGELLVVDESDMTATVKAATAVFRGSDWKLEFESLDGTKTVQIDFDIKRASVAANPKVTLKTGTTAAKKVDSVVEYTFDYGVGDKIMQSVTGITYLTSTGVKKQLPLDSQYVDLDLEEKTLAITAFKKMFDGSDWRLEFGDDEGGYYAAPFTLRDSSIRISDTKPTAKVDTAVSHWNTDAKVSFTLGSGKYAMDRVDHLEYTDRNGNLITINANSGGFTVDEDTAKATITMTIPIYAGSKWKLCFVNNDDVTPIFESVDLALLADPHDDPPLDSPPSASVTQTAGDIGEEVVIVYDLGYGPESKAKVARLDYTSKAGGSASVTTSTGLTISQGSVTFIATDGVYKSRLGDWRLVFTDADGVSNPYPVAVDIKSADAVEYPDLLPKIVSIKQAQDLGDTVSIVVDFGQGEDARPVIRYFEYTPENGVAQIVKDGDGVTISGEKVTIPVTRDIYVGSDWKLIFVDNDGKNPVAVKVPLKADDAVPNDQIDKDPTAEVPETVQVEVDGELVTKPNKAMNVQDQVRINVNYGKGLKERPKISSLLYTVPATEGKEAVTRSITPDTSRFIVSGSTVTVKMVKALYTAQDWTLVFTDAKGANAFNVPVDLKGEGAAEIEETNDGPSLTVQSVPAAAGGQAVLLVEGGNMTPEKFLYRDNTGAVGSLDIPSRNVAWDPDTGTITITALNASFNGSNWGIQFTNDDEKKVVNFDLKEPGGPYVDSDPTVTVTAIPSAAGQKAILKLTYGTGEAEKAKALCFVYVTSGKEATLNVGTRNVVQDGDTITITALKASFNGSGWKIRFQNENDENDVKDVAFNLKKLG